MIIVPIIFTVLEKVQPCSIKIYSAHKIKGALSQTPARKRPCATFRGNSNTDTTHKAQRSLKKVLRPFRKRPSSASSVKGKQALITLTS
jgi:hypothetical protein